jgi:hypothetical protein
MLLSSVHHAQVELSNLVLKHPIVPLFKVDDYPLIVLCHCLKMMAILSDDDRCKATAVGP